MSAIHNKAAIWLIQSIRYLLTFVHQMEILRRRGDRYASHIFSFVDLMQHLAVSINLKVSDPELLGMRPFRHFGHTATSV